MNKQEEEAIKKISKIVEECEYVPANEYKILLNLIKQQQKELKRLGGENQYLVEELFKNCIPKDVIREKLKFYETLPNVGIFQSKEAIIRVLKELLGE